MDHRIITRQVRLRLMPPVGTQRGGWLTLLLALWTTRTWAQSISSESLFKGMDVELIHRHRCAHTTGSWCQDFLSQLAVPTKSPPRGDKACPNDCSKVGQCQYDFGICDCPAGRDGSDCARMDKRECANMGSNRKDVDYTAGGWMASRCAGVCDDNRAICWCDKGKFKHEMGPSKGDPLAAPVKQGRPMVQCQMRLDAKERPVPWTANEGATYEELFGDAGWCNADRPFYQCACWIDGLDGEYCDKPTEHMCLNQCGGHGTCVYGFCRCDEGWYGQDCTRRKKGLSYEPGVNLTAKPYLTDIVVTPPAALDVPLKASRLRPLIYVYDLPSKYYRRMLEHRNDKSACTWRIFDADNTTRFKPSAYSVEQLLHEALLQSEHRTFDPEEADFFYVPVYTSCFFWPVHGYADAPAWPVLGGPRPMHTAMMLLQAKRWIQRHHPWWDKNGGKDHIFLLGHDEGACWAPLEIMNATLLVHWGRMDANSQSQTGFWMDDFDLEFKVPGLLPQGWLQYIKPHKCYDPTKDLVIPGIKDFTHFSESHYLGAPKRPRNTLLFFRGDFREKDDSDLAKRYSRGLRQRVRKLAKDNKWKEKYKIVIANREESWQPYGVLMSQTKFALVLPGDGWSGRMQDAVLYGAIPVIVMDNTHEKFETVLNFSEFSLRVNESDLERLPEILHAITPEQMKSMRKVMAKIWPRFLYFSQPWLEKKLHQVINRNLRRHTSTSTAFENKSNDSSSRDDMAGHSKSSSFHGDMVGHSKSNSSDDVSIEEHRKRFIRHYFRSTNLKDDAISTIIQWLYSRIPYVKNGQPRAQEGAGE